MSVVLKFVILIFASILACFDVCIFIKSRSDVYDKTGLKIFLMEDLFFVGEYIIKVFHFKVSGKRTRKLEEIYDRSTAGKISKSATVAPYTYTALFLPVLLMIFAMTENKVAVLLISVLVIFLITYFDIWLDGFLKKRHTMILREFATVLSKMSLLVNAGITATEAFDRVSKSNEGIIYDEMRKAKSEMDNGKAIELALEDFGFRCGCKEVRKFVSLYLQNMVKGGPEFSGLLQDMAEKAWDERKTRARLAGAAAEQKLLIPIMIMFIGVLIMVIVPAFNNLF